jgi:hypothetical protein
LRANPAVFSTGDGKGVVYIRPVVFAQNKPVILHELLHAYHFAVLGFDRAEIKVAYQHARNAGHFPERFLAAHFLQNEQEFFAVTATLYLFGDIQQPPFSCTALSQLDEAYLAFLSTTFGPHTCHAGAVELK